jgi:hypothetical protein
MEAILINFRPMNVNLSLILERMWCVVSNC